MKFIYLIIVVFIFTYCSIPSIHKQKEITKPNDIILIDTLKYNDNIETYVYEIDGCEYIGEISIRSAETYLTHKGNCKNKKHG